VVCYCLGLRTSTTWYTFLPMGPCSGAVFRHSSRISRQIASPDRRYTGDRLRTEGVGSDALGAWSNLAALVASSGSGKKTPFDGLADKIGG